MEPFDKKVAAAAEVASFIFFKLSFQFEEADDLQEGAKNHEQAVPSIDREWSDACALVGSNEKGDDHT